jgi:hypothetical protein
MDRAGHYREAERYADQAATLRAPGLWATLAQVHATLASVPAEVEAEAMARDQRAAERAEQRAEPS